MDKVLILNLLQLHTIQVGVSIICSLAIIGHALLYYLIFGLELALGYYLWDVVFSVYKDIKKENEETSVHVKFENKA